MSKGLSIIYQSNISSKEWSILQELCRDRLLSKEDLTLIRVYLILLGQKVSNTDIELQDQITKMIGDNKTKLNSVFNPETHFTFGPVTLT